MDDHTCETCDERFQTKAELAMHTQNEHSHKTSDEVIVGMPPKSERPG